MLPFLQPKKIATMMVASKKPDGSIEQEGPADEPNHALLAAAEDLISAVHMKDAKAVAEAIESAFEICDSNDDNEGGGDSSHLFEPEGA